ncbi:MAG: AI-2E family transporter, partial [Chryseobacterium sp.]
MNTQLPFLVKLPLVLITLLCLGYLASIGQFILAPLLFAFFLSILFTPFASFLERRLRFNRPLSTVAAVAVMILILAGISYFFANQLSDLSNDWPLLKEQVTKSYNQFIGWIQRTFNIRIDNKMPDYLQQGMDKLLSSTAWVATLMLGLFSSSIGFAFFSVLFFFFILNYRRLLHNFIISVFREQHLPKVREVIDEVQRIVKKYITGLILQILMVSTMTTVFLSILGVKYAVLL